MDHCRGAKKRCLNIRNSRGEKRKKHYRDLLKIARRTLGYGTRALEQAPRWQDPISQVLAQGLAHHLDLMGRVIQQTQRRVIRLPADSQQVGNWNQGVQDVAFGRGLKIQDISSWVYKQLRLIPSRMKVVSGSKSSANLVVWISDVPFWQKRVSFCYSIK